MVISTAVPARRLFSLLNTRDAAPANTPRYYNVTAFGIVRHRTDGPGLFFKIQVGGVQYLAVSDTGVSI